MVGRAHLRRLGTGAAAQRSPRSPAADDASSFYGNNRMSRTSNELLSAGYNQTSFVNPGRIAPLRGGRDEEMGFAPSPGGPGGVTGRASSTVGRNTPEIEDPGWDVFNDFNNKGRRKKKLSSAPLPERRAWPPVERDAVAGKRTMRQVLQSTKRLLGKFLQIQPAGD